MLESYKKDGSPKSTPVQSIEDGGLGTLRTDPNTWKVKRIRRNPHVRIALSDRSGRPTGNWFEGEAHVLEGEENDRMMKIFRERYGAVGYPMVNIVGRLRGERLATVVSIRLKAQAQ